MNEQNSGLVNLAREWERIRRDLAVAATHFQRYLEEDLPRYMARLQELGQAIRGGAATMAHTPH